MVKPPYSLDQVRSRPKSEGADGKNMRRNAPAGVANGEKPPPAARMPGRPIIPASDLLRLDHEPGSPTSCNVSNSTDFFRVYEITLVKISVNEDNYPTV